jgi:hypothetical protein
MHTTRENENRYCIGKILNLRNFRNKLYKKNTADWSKPSKWKLSDSGDEGKFLQRSERADLLADQVVLYDITDYVGDSRTLTLAKIGDYVEFWNSDSIINNAIDPFLRAFGNRAESIQLPENMCIRQGSHSRRLPIFDIQVGFRFGWIQWGYCYPADRLSSTASSYNVICWFQLLM